MPDAAIIPELAYDDVTVAVRWLCEHFGLCERLLIADHRAQLTFGNGALIVMKRVAEPGAGHNHTVMVRVPDVEAHYARSLAKGVRIIRPPATHPYGERQYTAEDVGGHFWTFSETVLDVNPQTWGGELKE